MEDAELDSTNESITFRHWMYTVMMEIKKANIAVDLSAAPLGPRIAPLPDRLEPETL